MQIHISMRTYIPRDKLLHNLTFVMEDCAHKKFGLSHPIEKELQDTSGTHEVKKIKVQKIPQIANHTYFS